MAILTDPDSLSQGGSTSVAAATFGAPAGRILTITAAATLPVISAGDFFEVRGHTSTQNNGLWKETGGSPTTSSITATKVSGAAPVASGATAITMLGTTANKKNIFWDVAARDIYLLEQNGLGADGVTGQCLYSKAMIDWKDDPFLIANAPFPMTCIDADAGKYFLGQDPTGNYNGWAFEDNGTYSIRTRKLLRSMGWAEVDSLGNTQAIYSGIVTLGGFEDEGADTAYYQFGNDTTVDDTVDYTFAGPVNEAVQAYARLATGAINGGTGIAISVDGRTLTRSDGFNWRTDGFKVGGRIAIRDAEQATNNGSFKLWAVANTADGAVTVGTPAATTVGTGFDFVDGGALSDTIVRHDGGSWIDEGYYVAGKILSSTSEGSLNDRTATITGVSDTTITVATATITAATDDNSVKFSPIIPTGTPDTTMNASVDNRYALTLRLRIRDADLYGKTFDQASLSSIGKTAVSNFVFTFPLANAADLKIAETDANIDANAPYTGMSLTVYSTPQSKGGAGANALVGGPYNFGFVLNCNSGTKQQAFEWLQRQLRKTTDIDAGGGTCIGRTLDGLARFLGDAFEAGSVNGGLSFPRNPNGGGSGVFLDNLAAASRNTSTMFDNLGSKRSYPVGTVVTLDANTTLEGDTVAAYTLFYDRTIRNNVADLKINIGTGPVGTITSVGNNLPATLNRGVGAYVRVSGLSGADIAMNGVYQVTSIAVGSYGVVRYDGTTIVTTTAGAAYLDQNVVDSPNAIIVQDNTSSNVSGTFGGTDFQFTYDYTGNTQGGGSGGADKYVFCRALGQSGAQYTSSTVSTIESGVNLTIPLVSSIERNFSNP
jgi:hypothetical protein